MVNEIGVKISTAAILLIFKPILKCQQFGAMRAAWNVNISFCFQIIIWSPLILKRLDLLKFVADPCCYVRHSNTGTIMRPRIEISEVSITQHDLGKAIFFEFRIGHGGQKEKCLEWLTDDLRLVELTKSNITGLVELGELESLGDVLYVRDLLEECLNGLLGPLRVKAAASSAEEVVE